MRWVVGGLGGDGCKLAITPKSVENQNQWNTSRQVRHSFVQEAEICLRPTQGQPEDHL